MLDTYFGFRVACTNTPELFFPDPVTKDPGAIEYAKLAKRVCLACPAMKACREQVLSRPDVVHGIWGGMTLYERNRERRSRKLAAATAEG